MNLTRNHEVAGSIPGLTQCVNECSPMFIVVLFTTAKTLKQPKRPLTEEWTKKIWYIYTMEYYSAIKKNEIFPVAAR